MNKLCPFLQAPCCEGECMLWEERCALLEINANLQQLHTATSAMWNHLRGGQNPAYQGPQHEETLPRRPAA